MKLYHFTGWLGLIGRAGFDAMKAAPFDGTADLRDLAAPGTILNTDCIKPMQDEMWPGLAPCVWLTDNPLMALGCSSYADWRLGVVIPSADRRLVKWTKIFRKMYGCHLRDAVEDDSLIRDGEGFYVYFGEVRRITTIGRVDKSQHESFVDRPETSAAA